MTFDLGGIERSTQCHWVFMCIIDNVLLDSGAVRPRGLLFTISLHFCQFCNCYSNCYYLIFNQARARTRSRKPISRLSVSVSVAGDVYAKLGDEADDVFVGVTCATLPKSVLLRTMGLVLAMLGILVVGVLCRLFIPVEVPFTDIPFNSTTGYNGTLPLLNITSLY